MEEHFSARAREVGAEVYMVANSEEATSRVAEILRDRGAQSVSLSPGLGDLEAPIRQAMYGAGVRVIESGASTVSVEETRAGITSAALGIAETGSLLIEGDALFPRLATMLPLVHVVVMPSSALVSSLDEAGEHLRKSALDGPEGPLHYASFVTGPSRTADIEKTLSTGVHGPGELHIVLISGE